jgi:ABC-type glycerol-3-phosphate transport system substrate-binding protein
MSRLVPALLASTLLFAPLGADGADLVVWWFKGFFEQEDAAVREIIAAFEQETGKHVELVQPAMGEMFNQANAALKAGSPPDFLYSLISGQWTAKWAYDDRLADLEGFLRPVLDLFDAEAIEASTLLNGKTGRRGLYALPMGRGWRQGRRPLPDSSVHGRAVQPRVTELQRLADVDRQL